jgi:hypothetical protein
MHPANLRGDAVPGPADRTLRCIELWLQHTNNNLKIPFLEAIVAVITIQQAQAAIILIANKSYR